MNIGIDIDDVITETAKAILNKANKKYSLNVKFEDLKSFNWWECTPITEEMFMQSVKELGNENALLKFELIQGSAEVISRLYKHHILYYVSARGDFWKQPYEHTAEYFRRNSICFDEANIFFSREKQIFAEKYNLIYFIEDNPKRALMMAENRVNVILPNKPWNKEAKHEQITRVEDWKEINEIFEKERLYSK